MLRVPSSLMVLMNRSTTAMLPCGSALCDPPLYTDHCCAYADLDEDGQVDLRDFAAFQEAFTGP